MTGIRRSLAWTAALSYVNISLQLISTVVLSRMLTPTQVGVFAVAAVFTALAVSLRDFGISEYVIQAKDLTSDRLRAAFTANLALSWFMGLVIFLAAGPTGRFYGDDGITAVMQLQAVNFIFIPFGAISMAWCRRNFRFRELFFVGTLGDLVNFLVSITLAFHGFGAISLAWASLAGTICTVLVYQWFREPEIPRWPGVRGIGEVLRFGVFASGMNLLTQLGRSAPEMIIGKFSGITDVALFSRAGGLVQLFRQLVARAVAPVCLPFFARSVREEDSVGRAYGQAVAIFTVVGWPFVGFLAIETFPAIRLIYGAQWIASVPLAQILCIAGCFEVLHFMAKDALLSHGNVKMASRLQLLQQISQVLGLLAVVPFGLTGACWGLLASSMAGAALAQWHMHTSLGWRMGDLWLACRTSARVSAVALAPALLLTLAIPAGESNFFWHLLASGACTVVGWLIALRHFQHPLWPELVRAIAPVLQRAADRLKRPSGA